MPPSGLLCSGSKLLHTFATGASDDLGAARIHAAPQKLPAAATGFGHVGDKQQSFGCKRVQRTADFACCDI
jgi:hypothetical protein